MEMDRMIANLGGIKSRCTSEADRGACAEAVSTICALQDGGIHTAEEAKDLVHDYNALTKQYQAMYRRFGDAGHAVHKDGVWHCPNCNRRVTPGHSFCHWCGKKMEWWGSRKGGRRHA